ncbi:N-6 DNA methylase [Flavobacterium hibisci]|uniref:N-6 DNA methylase n=1 Tax=Flavobacterium hibisci TaxID=1914462 RepID=UPI001CBE2FC2|nr:N-6 DNA methylase [Flavobacterium hibisci]MBZ4042858.1 SAM-dependent methyltransferase [Flavobacterium hibisci]
MAKKRAESRTRYFIRNQSEKRLWNVSHISKGGDFVEEQEIINSFSDIGLALEKPDFLVCFKGEPIMVIEAKNDAKKIEEAIEQSIRYCETINRTKKYKIKFAVGVAGEEDNGFFVKVRYLQGNTWKELKSNGYELSTIPSKKEIELAIIADDGTTNVTVPSSSEFIDAAIELSKILRYAKIEAPLRPKVIGAITLAIYQGEVDTSTGNELNSLNKLVKEAINESVDLRENTKLRLEEALRLSGADFNRLSSKIQRIISILKRLNIRSVLQSDTDFLGLFYEAFLRYGYDNNALGIVFTPRHITTYCVKLIGARLSDRVIDIASGTGGFLVAAFDEMMSKAKGPKAILKVKNSLYGFDTNPTVWALATLNMFFRGDGKSHIENSNCFDNKDEIEGKFTRAFLNPPFSQEEEPERDFIDLALESLEPGGLIAVVVKAGIFADDDNKNWRQRLVKSHSILGVISLPEDLFYPTAAPSSILIARAHIPQSDSDKIFMGRIWNDGYEKLKGKRVECDGSQLDEILTAFETFKSGNDFTSDLATTILGLQIIDGQEFSPQQWLPQPSITTEELKKQEQKLILSLFQAVSSIPELADEVLPDFPLNFETATSIKYGTSGVLTDYFYIVNGRSSGEKNYSEGNCPYVSSGDLTNSIIRLVAEDDGEVFENGGITITAFGQAYIQPWRFMARGNGGSSVRVLIPKYQMSFNELLWFATQINTQKWRFFYGRMAIKSRLERLEIDSPKKKINDSGSTVFSRIEEFKNKLFELSEF